MNNFFDSLPYLKQMTDQFSQVFGDDFVKQLMGQMNGMNPQAFMNPQGQQQGMPNMQNAGQRFQGDAASGPAGGMPGGGMGAAPAWNPFGMAGASTGAREFPSVDVFQSTHEVILLIEVPGLERASDVKLSVMSDKVQIQGEIHRTRKVNKDWETHVTERYIGPFKRVVDLPARVRRQHAKAVYQQGLLELRLLKENRSTDTDGTVIDIDFA